MNSVKTIKKSQADCSSNYSLLMGMLYNVEDSVEKMMKIQEASFKYNNCIYFKQLKEQKEQKNMDIIISFR